jgi:hypothetical protein
MAVCTGASLSNSASVQRTLTEFATDVDRRSTQALQELDHVLARLTASESDVAKATHDALTRIPDQVQKALGGEAGNVRAAVAEATRTAQATALLEIRASLESHSRSVREALTLDRGPVQELRRDLLASVDGTRKELATALAGITSTLAAAQAHRAAIQVSTRRNGDDFEADALAQAERLVTGSGDLFAVTAGEAGLGTTRRSGDATAVLRSPGLSQELTIVIECKTRSAARPLTVKALREEAAQCRLVRQAAAALILVPSADQVPGEGRMARLDDVSFVVALDQPDVLQVVWLTLRELTLVRAVRSADPDGVNLPALEQHVNAALEGLRDFEEVARLSNLALKNLEALKVAGNRGYQRIKESLNASIGLLSG